MWRDDEEQNRSGSAYNNIPLFHNSSLVGGWWTLSLHSSPAITPHRMQSVSSGDLFYSEKEGKSSIIKIFGIYRGENSYCL